MANVEIKIRATPEEIRILRFALDHTRNCNSIASYIATTGREEKLTQLSFDLASIIESMEG